MYPSISLNGGKTGFKIVGPSLSLSLQFSLCQRNSFSKNASFTSFACLPYYCESSDKSQRILNEISVKLAIKLYFTIDKFVPSLFSLTPF